MNGRADSPDFCQEDPWVVIGDMLSAVETAIRSDDCRAVFLVGESGFGTSSLLNRLGETISTDMELVHVHGSFSLSAVPYGALAQYLTAISMDEISSQISVLRALWAYIGHDIDSGIPVVLLIDDAHDLDTATAELVTGLVQAGWAKVVAACKPLPGIPTPLRRLWDGGAAERFDLIPLTAEQGHELCAALLGDAVPVSTSRSLWLDAGGNPLLLKTLVSVRRHAGTLVRRNGVWLVTGKNPGGTFELEEMVKIQLMGISAEGREALNLIALSEPVDRSLVGKLVQDALVRELLDQHLITDARTEGQKLRLANPVYGVVLRGIVPVARSLQLHRRLIEEMDVLEADPESLLRMATWALDCGADVSDELLIRAAILACNLFQNETSVRIAAAVNDPILKSRARAVMARAQFNMGHYEQAAALLDHDVDEGDGLAEKLFGSLLSAATHSASGHSAEDILGDARTLREWGQEQAHLDSVRAFDILSATRERAALVELLAHSLQGDYVQMADTLALLKAAEHSPDSPPSLLARAFTLAIDSERLCALGFPLHGRQRAIEAFAIKPPSDQDIFFLPEFILVRRLACALTAGNWTEVQQILDASYISSAPDMVSFSGSANVALGFMAIRQGKMDRARTVLLAGLEALRESDPQQMFPLCVAMAFYACAAQGLRADAARLKAQYAATGPMRGMHLIAAHTQGFFAAGVESLDQDGSGIAALRRSAEAAEKQGAGLLELHSLQLAVSLGDTSRLDRFCYVAGSAEGSWAQSLAQYGQALRGGDAASYLRAADSLYHASVFQIAAEAYTAALRTVDGGRDKELTVRARTGLARCKTELDQSDGAAQDDARAPLLTKRERAIALLAARGLSDREIADKLHVSVRTVEGHLYRCYAKLGIEGRGNLITTMGL